MHLEVLIEDKSGAVVMRHLLADMLDKTPHTWTVRPHRGKGYWPENWDAVPKHMASGLYDLLPAKLRAYADQYSDQPWTLVVIVDSDTDHPDDVTARIRSAAARYAGRLPVVIGVSVEEMEAWLLGDPQAIREAYPEADMSWMARYRQDSICGTWEILAHVLMGTRADRLIKVGYPAVGQFKSEWAEQIAPCMAAERNRSPSFQKLRKALLKVLEQEAL